MKKRKLLFVMAPVADPSNPAFTRRFEEFARTHEVHVLVQAHEEMADFERGGARFHLGRHRYTPNLARAGWRFLRHALRGLGLHRRHRYDIVVTYDALASGLIGALLKTIFGGRLVVEVNGHQKGARDALLDHRNRKDKTFKQRCYDPVITLTLGRADAVKLLNTQQYRELGSDVRAAPCYMFHDYIPTDAFSPGREKDYVLFVGHPFHRKGVDVLLEAFNRISDRFSGVRLVVVGHCREPHRSHYRELAAGNPAVEFLLPMPPTEIVEWFEGCLFFVLPSRSEGMGRVLIEAMAAGKPCVGSDVGGIRHVIRDGETGLLFESENAADLAGKMDRLLSDPGLRRAMGEKALGDVERRFSARRYFENYERVFKTLADEAEPAAGLHDLYGE